MPLDVLSQADFQDATELYLETWNTVSPDLEFDCNPSSKRKEEIPLILSPIFGSLVQVGSIIIRKIVVQKMDGYYSLGQSSTSHSPKQSVYSLPHYDSHDDDDDDVTK